MSSPLLVDMGHVGWTGVIIDPRQRLAAVLGVHKSPARAGRCVDEVVAVVRVHCGVGTIVPVSVVVGGLTTRKSNIMFSFRGH